MPVVRRRKPAPDVDEYDEKPRRRRDADDDERDEEETPRRRRATRDDDEDKPRRRVSRSSRDEDDEDEKPRRRSRRDEEDEEDRPRRRSSRDDDDDADYEEEDEDEVSERSSSVQAGWKAAKKVQSDSGDFMQEFKFTEEETLVKFLGDEPFGSYKQHWLNDREGKKSFICAEKGGCALCDRLGDRPSGKTAFNVIVLSGDDVGEVKALICGSRLLTQLEKKHKDPKQGPLDKHYWSLSRSGKKGSYATNLGVVKERDLEDDWELTVDEAEDYIEGAKLYTQKDIRPSGKADLTAVAKEYE